MNFRHILASFALVPAAVAMGCSSEDMLEEEVTASTRQALSDPNFEMPQNGLDPDAAKVNDELLAALRTRTLSDAGLNAMLSDAPDLERLFYTGASTGAQYLMQEVVSCALDSTQTVTMGAYPTWRGKFGLCGSWSNAAPTDACLELVSACVLARMNALGRHVPISIHVPGDLGPSPKVRVQTTLRTGARIESFDRCCSGFPPFCNPYMAADTCNWSPEFVGICEQGTLVTLQRNQWLAVRVCSGIHGCEKDQPDQSFPDFPTYAGYVAQFDGGDTAITFSCPTEGVHPRDKPNHRYFSVMVPALHHILFQIQDDAIVGSGANVTYPANEREVFTYPEGSFYGDIFKETIGDIGYVCHSDIWRTGGTYLTDRICANPNDLETCGSIGGRAPCLDVCASGLSAPPEETYNSCEDGGRTWNGVTVFLNDHYDLSRTPANAAIVCSHDECTTGAALDDGCSAVVTSVCAADPYCCNTEWDRLCVGEVQSVANNLMCPIGTCSHSPCTVGEALVSSCDVPPLASSGCVKLICDADPYCCNTAWDNICISEVQSVCGKSCN